MASYTLIIVSHRRPQIAPVATVTINPRDLRGLRKLGEFVEMVMERAAARRRRPKNHIIAALPVENSKPVEYSPSA